MANYTVASAKSATVADVDNITFSRLWDSVVVYNADPTNSLWVRVDGGAASVAGAECYVVPPVTSLVLGFRAQVLRSSASATGLVSVAGSGAYTVMGTE